MNSPAPPESPPSLHVPAPAAASARTSRPHRLAWAVGAVALLVMLAWWDARSGLDAVRRDTERRLAEQDGRQIEVRAVAGADHDALAALRRQVDELEARLAESREQAAAVESLYAELVRSRDERLAADAEQALAQAALLLQPGGNPAAALVTLQALDARLGSAPPARFGGLRRLVARDIERVRALPAVDLAGWTQRIEGAATAIDGLPLAFERRPEAKAAPKGSTGGQGSPGSPGSSGAEPGLLRRLGGELWREVRQLVRIERTDLAGAVDPVLLAPAQAEFLREHLRLRLLGARVALQLRDGPAYRNDLRRAREILERHFDTQAKPVQAVLATVARLAEANPAQEPPSLAESLAAVRQLRPAGAR